MALALAIVMPDCAARAASEVELPLRNPKRGPATAAAVPTPPTPPVQQSADVPLPDRKPTRATAAPTPTQAAVAAVPTPAITAPLPKPDLPDLTVFLKPVVDFKLSDGDKDSLKAAIRASYAGGYAEARAAIKTISDRSARKVAQWYYYRSKGSDAAPEDIEKFRIDNPDWPNGDKLRANAELSLLKGKGEAKKVIDFFAASPPATGAGMAALGTALLAQGDKARATMLIRAAWRSRDLDEDVEALLLSRFSDILVPADHKARVDRLLLADRAKLVEAVTRTAKLLDENDRKKIDARVAVVRRSSKAEDLLKAISAEAQQNDTGFYFSRIQHLCRQDKSEEAWKLLVSAPSEPEQLVSLEDWWIERRVNCRAALDAGKPQLAYDIVKGHGPIKGEPYEEAQFLAGWIALRYLNKPELAFEHFVALRTAATDADVISRAEYWLGRTARARKNAAEAEEHFRKAATYPLTYYGQLAVQALNPAPAKLALAPNPIPTADEAARFAARDSVRAIRIAHEAGLEALAPFFYQQLARTLKSPGEAILLAELARRIDDIHDSVRLAKIALNYGLPTGHYAYPVGVLPDYKRVTGEVESALLHALSRQESEFNPRARSPVGARGLMQLMPRTARMVAKQHKVKYRPANLTTDASYNMMLGAAHLRDLIDEYGGSYIMTLVAYNAGPSRVIQWMEASGDPRDPRVDPIDWVERIPFTETREYVQKILSTTQIFRSQLQGPQSALQLLQDMHRGRSDGIPGTTASTSPASAAGQ
ncbi:MAG: lytic transglycosylase domain-containing protein [Pseudomonadota bacterium]|nr:lytic transglycosylase domain-containing protein [Pseudomonadota bacterium]